MKNKIILFCVFSFFLTFEFLFAVNKQFQFLKIDFPALTIFYTFTFFIKILFFLPIFIFQQVGYMFGNMGDVLAIPIWWQFLTFALSLAYAWFLSSKLTNRATRKTFIWLHVSIFCIYLFFLASLFLIWQNNPYSVVSATLRKSNFLYVGSLFSFVAIPVSLFLTRRLLKKN